MDFARHKRSGYARLGKVDFQRPVRAAKKVFGSCSVWKAPLFTERSLLMPYAFAFQLLFQREMCLLTSIETSVSFVR